MSKGVTEGEDVELSLAMSAARDFCEENKVIEFCFRPKNPRRWRGGLDASSAELRATQMVRLAFAIGPCRSLDPATFDIGGTGLHLALTEACAQAAERGLIFLGYIAVKNLVNRSGCA